MATEMNVEAEPAAQAQPRDYLAWWTSIETDVRKSMLVFAHREPERLHALVRQAYEAGQQSMQASRRATQPADVGAGLMPQAAQGVKKADLDAREWMAAHGYGNATVGHALADLQSRIEAKDRELRELSAQLARQSHDATPSQAEPVILNVRDFGAMGDGVTDDTAAIQSALDAMRDAKRYHWMRTADWGDIQRVYWLHAHDARSPEEWLAQLDVAIDREIERGDHPEAACGS